MLCPIFGIANQPIPAVESLRDPLHHCPAFHALLRRAHAVIMRPFVRPLLAIATITALSSCAGPADDRSTTVEVGALDPAVSPDGSQIAVAILGRILPVPIEGGVAEP